MITSENFIEINLAVIEKNHFIFKNFDLNLNLIFSKVGFSNSKNSKYHISVNFEWIDIFFCKMLTKPFFFIKSNYQLDFEISDLRYLSRRSHYV